MVPTSLQMILGLIQAMSVVMVLAYILTRTEFFNDVLQRRHTPRNLLYLSIFFGLLSIYGTVAGFDLLGAKINIRDLGPSLAGLIGGPLAGLGAGVIGGVHRFFLGGPTCTSCSVSTILAGLLAGLVCLLRRGRLVSVWQAALFGLVMEAVHMGLALVLVTGWDQPSIPWSSRLDIVRGASLPMMIANSLGMALFVLIVRNLKREREVEAAKKFMEGELKVARDIQMGIVPKIFPPYPERVEFDLYATLEPAKEVGGDLYDFYELDDRHLFFVLGDVSGKGVPASLFMAITLALFKANANKDRGPEEILAAVNAQLARDNESCMFVTLFCGILDIETGWVTYACAGHNPPLILRSSGLTSFLEPTRSLVAGASDLAVYRSYELNLGTGDTLLLYTDGVTEAMNQAQELYAEERLIRDASELAHQPPRGLIEGLIERVRNFAGDAPQSDDITLLALTYRGEKKIKRFDHETQYDAEIKHPDRVSTALPGEGGRTDTLRRSFSILI
ncbi:MAG TPA: serine/threonine protein phosphatase [Desulfobacteraceae bacterium]|nr:serine/threonine protein phosphatase [Desulfobacteraceae bacterium]